MISNLSGFAIFLLGCAVAVALTWLLLGLAPGLSDGWRGMWAIWIGVPIADLVRRRLKRRRYLRGPN